MAKVVRVADIEKSRIGLHWDKYDATILNYFKKEFVKNEDYYIVGSDINPYTGKPKKWTYYITYRIASDVLDALADNGYDVSQVESALKDIEEGNIKLNGKKLSIEDDYRDSSYVIIRYGYDRSIKPIIDPIPVPLKKWRYIEDGKYDLAVKKFVLKDILPMFEKEGYSIDEFEDLMDEYDLGPEIELIEVYDYWITSVEKQKYDQYRRENMAEILSDNDLAKMEDGEYEMIDLSKRKLPFTPYEFQINDIKTMLKYKRFLNSSEMGLGKSFEAVVVGESIPGKKLIVCPASLRLNWVREIKNVNKKAKIDVLYSADEFHCGEDWTIIAYPGLEKHLSSLEKAGFKVVFFDEAHFIQATTRGYASSKRAKAALKLGESIEYVYPITGTPKTNRNKNLYNILKLLKHPLAQGKHSYEAYADRYCGGCYAKGKEDKGNSHDRELNKRIAPWMVRRLRKDVLPNLTKQRIIVDAEVNLSEYEEAMKRYREVNKDPSLTGKQRFSASLGELQKARVALAKEKIESTINLAKDFVKSEESVVIITCFKSVVKAVENEFKDRCVKITGGMSDKQKQESIDRFQSGEVPVIVMNVIAGGVGVTLTKAHIAIVNDYEFTVGNMVQAEDRICRVGQDEHCLIYYVSAIGSSLDESFMGMLSRKSESINSVVDGGRGETVNFVAMLNESLGISAPISDDISEEEAEEIMKEIIKED